MFRRMFAVFFLSHFDDSLSITAVFMCVGDVEEKNTVKDDKYEPYSWRC